MHRFLGCVLALWVAGCATAGPPTRPNDREWNRLAAEHQWLETLRNSAARIPLGAPRKQAIEILLDNHKKLEPTHAPFLERLKDYYDRTADPRAARMFAAEKIRLGDEYLTVLSRFDRAIGMYETALAVDPQNDEARRKLEGARARRFVAMDIFAGVRQGMKEEEVRKIVGVPREDWIKQVVQKNRAYSVWIYPKIDGGAAAIYFDNGVVYHTNWNAAPSQN